MKKYAKYIVTAEQFTDDHTPEGVKIADDKYKKAVLVPSLYDELKDEAMYCYVYPRPAHFQKEVSKLFGEKVPATWIKKGDYIIHYEKWDEVESKKIFEKNYKEVQIVKP